jgi:putative glutathione S-transferase
LLGLEQAISIGMTGIYRSEKGWVFGERPEDVDPVLKIHYLHDIYTREEPDYEGRSTVPIIVDTITGKGANNDHFWLSIYLSTAWKKYHKPDAPDLYPTDLRDEIDELNRFIYERINDGVYNCGFARSQDAYDLAYERFFEAMDLMDARLKDRRFLFGDFVTDSDLRIYPSLARFYITYYQVFRVNRTRLEDFENLWGYAKDLYRIPEIRDTTHFDLIKKHYQLSPHLRPLWGNVNGICAKGPDVGIWEEPHGRARLSGHPGERFLR